MNKRKQKHHEAIRARALRALENLYHNATPNYPSMDNEYEYKCFQEWFQDEAQFEIEYIRNDGAYAPTQSAYGDILKSDAERKYKSKAAQLRYIYRGMREMQKERDQYARWERINEYGQIYQWGRGGRTLAPENLIKQGGGSLFYINTDAAEECTIAACIELIQVVESFNSYVKSWNQNIPDMWKETKRDKAEQDAHEAREQFDYECRL